MTPKWGLTLAERSALRAAPGGPAAGGGEPPLPPAAAATGTPAGPVVAVDPGRPPLRPRARHCWVRDPPGAPGRWPGLLAEWQPAAPAPAGGEPAPDRHGGRGWLGRVVYAVDDAGGCVLVETWLPAGQLEPADPPAAAP